MQNTLSLNRPLPLFYHFIPRVSLRGIWILGIVLIILLLVFYIFQVNSFARGNYLLQNYQKELSRLSGETEGLEINLSRSNSLANIDNYLLSQNFVKANQVRYIQILESQVVKK